MWLVPDETRKQVHKDRDNRGKMKNPLNVLNQKETKDLKICALH